MIRMAAAQDIFGRAGLNLLPMFDLTKQAMTDLRREAHELGLVFDPEAAAASERLTDAMNAQKRATDGIAIVIGENL